MNTKPIILQTPAVHLNGSGGQGLLDAYMKASDALEQALIMLRDTAPHGRDYYLGGKSIDEAIAQHVARYKAVYGAQQEIQKIWLDVHDQMEIQRLARKLAP